MPCLYIQDTVDVLLKQRPTTVYMSLYIVYCVLCIQVGVLLKQRLTTVMSARDPDAGLVLRLLSSSSYLDLPTIT